PFEDNNIIFTFDKIGSNSYISHYLIENSIVKWEVTDEGKEAMQKLREEQEKSKEIKEAQEKEQQQLQEAKRKEELEDEIKKQEAAKQFENTDYGKLQRAIREKFK